MALSGRTIIIFGGSSGMGKGTARAACIQGGIPWIVSRDAAKLASAADFITSGIPGANVKTSALDATDEESVKSFFAAIPAGTIHHLVCTMGPSTASGSLFDISMDKIRSQFEAKLFSALSVVKYGAPVLADGGSITFFSGALARRPGKGSLALAACNGALDTAAKALACDLGPRLRVNCLSPGLVDTEIWDGMPPEVKAGMLKGFGASIPAGRAGTIDDIGLGAVYLMTNSWVTGTVLDVDGGAVIKE